jgi:hypothetical protein
MLLAADWLDFYDPNSEGYAETKAVSDWIRETVQAKQEVEVARQYGVSVHDLRKVMKDAV